MKPSKHGPVAAIADGRLIKVVAMFGLAWLCAGHLHVHAQVVTEPLSPAGQLEFDTGVAAYKRQQWSVALKHFTNAAYEGGRYPYVAPQVAFNLGITHGQAGNEVAAIAWLEVYQITAPQAKNGEAVGAAIRELEAEAQRKIDKLFTEAISGAQRLGEEERRSVLATISMQQACAGDFPQAVRTGKLRTEDGSISAHGMDVIRSFYAASLLSSGDLRGAEEVLAHLQTAIADRNDFLNARLDRVFRALADSLAFMLGDFEGARQVIAKINDPKVREAAAESLENEKSRPGRRPGIRGSKPNVISAIFLAQQIDRDVHTANLSEDLRSAAGVAPPKIPARLGALAAVRAGYLHSIRALRRGFMPDPTTNVAVESAKALGGIQ